MNKLREKLLEAWVKPDSLQQCEQITDDFSVKFAEWLGKNQYSKHQINDRWYDGENFIGTTTELLQIFKDKYYE